MLTEYDEKKTHEAKCATALDKLEAMLHILSVGVEQDEFPNHTFHYADVAIQNFPLLAPLLEEIKTKLKSEYALHGMSISD